MSEPNGFETLKVVAVYSNGSAKRRITSVLKRIHDKVCPEVQFQISWVQYDHLEDPMVRAAMGQRLNQAQILCFALSGGSLLSPEVKQWLAGLRFPRDTDRRLIALLQISGSASMDRSASDAELFLQGLARIHDMDYLPYYTSDLTEADGEPWEGAEVIQPYHRKPQRYPPQASSLHE